MAQSFSGGEGGPPYPAALPRFYALATKKETRFMRRIGWLGNSARGDVDENYFVWCPMRRKVYGW